MNNKKHNKHYLLRIPDTEHIHCIWTNTSNINYTPSFKIPPGHGDLLKTRSKIRVSDSLGDP